MVQCLELGLVEGLGLGLHSGLQLVVITWVCAFSGPAEFIANFCKSLSQGCYCLAVQKVRWASKAHLRSLESASDLLPYMALSRHGFRLCSIALGAD